MFWPSVLFIVLECLSAGAEDGVSDGKDVVDVKFIPKEEGEAACCITNLICGSRSTTPTLLDLLTTCSQ
jgi:hypothetical protein